MQFTAWLSRSIAYGILPFSGDSTDVPEASGSIPRFTTSRRSPSSSTSSGTAFASQRRRFESPRSPPADWSRGGGIPLTPSRDRAATWTLIQSAMPVANSTSSTESMSASTPATNSKFSLSVSGSLRNLSDVGYGIASLLPFLTALGDTPPGTLFLLQQPEVHLHPSAQAKLIEMMARSEPRIHCRDTQRPHHRLVAHSRQGKALSAL